MKSQVVGTRIPCEWAEQLQSLADAEDSDVSNVVKEAIAQFLDVQEPDSTVTLKHRVSRLETQLSHLLCIAKLAAADREALSLAPPDPVPQA